MKFKQHGLFAALLSLILLFFSLAVFFTLASKFPAATHWNSPDETANYFFSQVYAKTGNLFVFEKYNLIASDIILPRSMRSDYGFVKPVSFLGMPLLYGKIASFSSVDILPYVTPMLAAVGIIFFFLLVRKLINRRAGMIAAILLAFLPPFFYYTVRGFFHNVPFLVFLIIGSYFLVSLSLKRIVHHKGILISIYKLFNDHDLILICLAGFSFGVAMAFRTSELLWFLPVLLVLWIWNFRRLSLLKPVLFVAAFLLALSPIFFQNYTLYSGVIKGGYAEMNTSINIIKTSSVGLLSFSNFKIAGEKIFHAVFFFGFDLKRSLASGYYYFVEMFPWIFWPMLCGILCFLINYRKEKRGLKQLFWAWILSSIILVLYYGSWVFFDNPDKTRHTIGNSYTRYFLPIYAGAIIFGSLAIAKLSNIFRSRKFGIIIAFGFTIFFSIYSLIFTIYGSEEALIYAIVNSRSDAKIYQAVMANTDKDGIIITKYYDKLLFPERKIIMGNFNDDNMIKIYSNLAKRVPVYYLSFSFGEDDIKYLNVVKLKPFKLKIELIKTVGPNLSLYRLQ